VSATEKYFPDGIDPRIAEILRLISQLARGNLDARGELSPDVDDLDGVLQGLNMLAEELSHTMVSLQQHRTLNAELQAALEQVSRHCVGFCRSARIARRSATAQAIGRKSRNTSPNIQRSLLATGSVRHASTSIIRLDPQANVSVLGRVVS